MGSTAASDSPGECCGWYQLVTWPGSLCIRGDYGTFVFSRVEDMFTFFRSPSGRINPSYWAEKVEAEHKHGGVQEWSHDRFTEVVVGIFREQWADRDRTERRECFRRLREEVLRLEDEHEAMQAAWAFRWKGFSLDTFYEHRMTEYTFHFLWCLHAIVRGIARYDEQTASAAA